MAQHTDTAIGWRAWSAETFDRAAREQKPVLLSITAAWCHACHEMDRTTYADEEVIALIHDRFVPVRVDTDRRPDVNDRYNLGGWPTTAFLTPDGDLLGGGTFVPVDRMAGVLRRVSEAFSLRTGEIEAARTATGRPEDSETGNPLSMDAVLAEAFGTFDELHGGFGIEPKFPHAAPVHLALALYRESGEPHWRTIAERTLDGIAHGGLRDPIGGGFFRYATTRNWQLPHVEKLLETNASLLGAYADAAATLDRASFREHTAETAAYIRHHLAAPGGGFYGSEAEQVLYANANAIAAGALIAAAGLLDDPAIAREALASLERVLLACYRPGRGVAHSFDREPGLRGLLGDQIATIGALLDAHDITGDEPYEMMAEELAHFAIREMWDAEGDGFFDKATTGDEIGLLRARRKPFVDNCEAARALVRLSRSSGDTDFRDRAPGALRAAAPGIRGQGPLAAHYALALRELSGG